jgi:hypothetical protein
MVATQQSGQKSERKMKKSKKNVSNPQRRSEFLDERGKFKKGNPGGPGNPNVRRLGEYQQAIREAVTLDDLKKVIQRVLSKAQAGDMMAVKELLDRVVGKAGVVKNADATLIELPRVATTEDCVTASNAIFKALSEGRLTIDDAAKLADIVEMSRRTLETHNIAERVAALEDERGAEDDA